jgi:DNA-directed RNA polymerase specialized sigma subunit
MRQVIEQELGNVGRPPKLSRADQLLLTLMYWREYRTEFHLGLAYGVSESTVCRMIKKIENTLIKSEQFQLLNKKALHSGSMALEIRPLA